MSVIWSSSLESGSHEIDTQHKELFLRVNNLLAAFEKGTKNTDEIRRIIDYLTDYVVLHFGNEERWMDKFGYSSTSAHKAQHEQFVKGFLKLKEQMLMLGLTGELAEDVKQLCVDWLINHIKYSDRALGMYLRHKMGA